METKSQFYILAAMQIVLSAEPGNVLGSHFTS